MHIFVRNYEQKIKQERVGGGKPSRPVTAQGVFEEVHFLLCSTLSFTFLNKLARMCSC